jgi:hypothetical protein
MTAVRRLRGGLGGDKLQFEHELSVWEAMISRESSFDKLIKERSNVVE